MTSQGPLEDLELELELGLGKISIYSLKKKKWKVRVNFYTEYSPVMYSTVVLYPIRDIPGTCLGVWEYSTTRKSEQRWMPSVQRKNIGEGVLLEYGTSNEGGGHTLYECIKSQPSRSPPVYQKCAVLQVLYVSAYPRSPRTSTRMFSSRLGEPPHPPMFRMSAV